MSQQPEFPGWESPSQNWSKLPHALVGLIPRMKESELKVTLYILRHTWGYGNYGKYQFMTLDEIMNGRFDKDGNRLDEGTGLSKQSVITAIRAGKSRGTLQELAIRNDPARIRKGYKLRGRDQDQGSKILTAEVKNLDTVLNKDNNDRDKDPQPKAEKPVRKATKYATFNQAMEKEFQVSSGRPLPRRVTAKERKQAGERWNKPLWSIYDLFRPDEERLGECKRQYEEETLDRAITLIRQATEQMKADRLTMDSPASILKVATSIFADQYVADGSDDFWDKYK